MKKTSTFFSGLSIAFLLGFTQLVIAEWKEFPATREVYFRHGYEVLNPEGKVVKTVGEFEMANLRAFQDIDGERYYVSDWSFQRIAQGIRPNLIRPVYPDQPEPDITDHIPSPAELRIAQEIQDCLNLVDYGDLDLEEINEFSRELHFYDIVFAHHPLTYKIFQEQGKGYGLGHIFDTPFDLDKTCMTLEWASGSAEAINSFVYRKLANDPHSKAFMESLPDVFQAVTDVYRYDRQNRTANRSKPVLPMPPNAAFVEIFRTDSGEYGSAYVANVYQDGKLVTREELFDAKAFDIFVELLLRNATKRGVVGHEDASAWLHGFFGEVYAKTFRRFESTIKDAGTIYWTGNGYFHFVPLEIIVQHANSPLSNTPLIRVDSASALATSSLAETWRAKGVLLVGDLNFDGDLPRTDSATTQSSLRGPVQRAYANRLLRFPNLPGTKVEIDDLATLLQNADSAVEVRSIRGNQGTESEILDALTGVGVAHFATHGFYLEDRKLSDSDSIAPYVRSGLTLTGANQTFQKWHRGDISVNTNDGVLLAAELKDLNFAQLELLVFSACSTAEGKPLDSGSVLSLQSAILETGVQNAITTLWEVSDEAAPVLMRLLYEELLQGSHPAEALWKARRDYFTTLKDSTNLWIAMRNTAPFICVSQTGFGKSDSGKPHSP